MSNLITMQCPKCGGKSKRHLNDIRPCNTCGAETEPLGEHTITNKQRIFLWRERADLNKWLGSEYLPRLVGGPVAISLRFDPRPLPADKLGHVRELEDVDRRCTLLHFLECDPRDCWDTQFSASGERLAQGAHGTLAMQAAFIPTRHGTNTYTDELF